MATRFVEKTKYYRIKEDIKRQILDGALRPGDRVMSEAEICRHYSVSRISAKRALDDLVWEGHIHRISGSGSYVADRSPRDDHPGVDGLFNEIRRRGMHPSSRLVCFEEHTAEERGFEQVRQILSLAPGERFYHIRRLRYADGMVIALDDTYIAQRHCPGLTPQELAEPSASLHRMGEERFGRKPDHAVETCRACELCREQADLLEMEPGAPALRVEHQAYWDGQVVGYSTRVFRGEVYEYRVDL